MKYQGIILVSILGVMLASIPVSLSAFAAQQRDSVYYQTPSVPMLPPESEIPPPLYPMFPPENIQQPEVILPEEKVEPAPLPVPVREPEPAPAPQPAPQSPVVVAPPIIINNNNNNNNNLGRYGGYDGYGAMPPVIIYPDAPRSETKPSTSVATPAQTPPTTPVAPAPVVAPAQTPSTAPVASASVAAPPQTPYTAPMQGAPIAPTYGYTPPVSGRQFITYQIRSALNDTTLKRVQYYLSTDILLSRTVDKNYKAPSVSAGEVVFSNGQYVERILISKNTPGQLLHKTVAYRQDGLAVELLGICFEQNRNNLIYFQPVYGFYGFMNAPGTNATGVQTKYGRYIYEVFLPESAWPYLMGTVNIEYKDDQSRNAPGRIVR